MKKFAFICVAALCVASSAFAQGGSTPDETVVNAIGLGWSSCSSVNPLAAANTNYLCENATSCPVFRLLPSILMDRTHTRFQGSITVIDVLVGSNPVVGDWWASLKGTGCRTAGFSTPNNIGAATNAFCTNLYPTTASGAGGQSVAANAGHNPLPNRYRITSSNSVAPNQSFTPGVRGTIMQIDLATEGTFLDCADPAGGTDCIDGCSAGACFVLNNVDTFLEVDQNPATPDIVRYVHDGVSRNFATWNSGTGANCPGATPTKPSTWGAVKALYR